MSSMADQSLDEVFRLLRQQMGIEPESVGVQNVAQVVRRQMAVAGAATASEFCRHLATDPSALEQLAEELLVPETWFFRDPLGFQCLGRRLADGQWSREGRTVRVLSIACSTGEEVYSLAMCLREAGLQPPQYSILGVDLSRKALASAQAGTYFARSFRESSGDASIWRERWFAPVDDAWRVCDDLRAGVEFRQANLSQAAFLPGEPAFDVIFCRNVLIYFHSEARRTAIEHVRRLLRADGLVWSAPAEAGIFANVGFRSLGSECPFVFGLSESGAVRSTEPPRSHRPREVHPRPRKKTARPAPASSQIAAPVSPAATLQAAQAAADQGRLDEADAACNQILAADAACADAHCLRGVIRQAQGRLGEAQRSFEKALYLEPRHYHSLVHVMLLAEQRGDRPAAANYRRRIEQVAAGETA